LCKPSVTSPGQNQPAWQGHGSDRQTLAPTVSFTQMRSDHQALLQGLMAVSPHSCFWKAVGQVSQRFLKAACNPDTLRKTTGVIFADRAGAGVLRWMGRDEEQAFACTCDEQAEASIFPSSKEDARNATTQRETSTN